MRQTIAPWLETSENSRKGLKNFLPTKLKKRFSGFKTVTNCVGRNFFEIFSWVLPRSTNQVARLSYRLSNSVVWQFQKKKFSVIKKNSSFIFSIFLSLLIIKYFIKIIREVEDSIQTALNDPGAESRHPYAPETQANNNSNQKNGVS